MVSFRIRPPTGVTYEELRDTIREALVGCPAFIDNQIMLSDNNRPDNYLTIILSAPVEYDSDLTFALVEAQASFIVCG